MLSIYNTLTRKKEEFVPLHGNTVTMYVCGITPYDEVHLGHARVYVTFDVIRRYLEHSDYRVSYIQNFTDVDDKIIRRAEEKKLSPRQLAQTYIDDYFTQMDKLAIKRADQYPRVTETIPQIEQFIAAIIEKGKAYIVDGDVYFETRKAEGYGKLSKHNIDDLRSGARVEVDQRKRDPLDFALWKKSKPGEPADVSWDSPWGKGRPGWHIECSVMSTNFLGPTIDIHGGGQDLIFPHHENEIAQSEAATGQPFVRYWIHNGFVTLNREKMSKSLGNFFTLQTIFEKYPPRVVRYFLLSQHYRSPLDFSDDKLKQAQAALEGIDDAYSKLAAIPHPEEHPARFANLEADLLGDVVARFRDAMDDDFNTEKALAVVHELKNEVLATVQQRSPLLLHKAYVTLRILLEDYLGIPLLKNESFSPDVLALKEEREKARREKNWKKADELRKKLGELGYRVEDTPDGTSSLFKRGIV
jgi:cysteinyl-tRNA synthetase